MTDFAWLDQIEKRVKAATPGEWYVGQYCINSKINEDRYDGICEKPNKDSAEFIAHSPTDIAKLIETVKVMKEVLEFYADDSIHKHEIRIDLGNGKYDTIPFCEPAREALERCK